MNETWTKRITRFTLATLFITFISLGMAMLLLEWMAGCGETYTDATGKLSPNQCIFIKLQPQPTKE